MAITRCSNYMLKEPVIWDAIERFSDTMEVVACDHDITTLRINNDEVPKEDVEIEIWLTTEFPGVQPMIISVKILSNGPY
jgi:hypothetical protein